MTPKACRHSALCRETVGNFRGRVPPQTQVIFKEIIKRYTSQTAKIYFRCIQ